MHAKVFKRESKTNNEHTVAVLCQRDDFILLYHFFNFYVFHHHAYPGTTLIKNGSSFLPPRLFWAIRLFGREE